MPSGPIAGSEQPLRVLTPDREGKVANQVPWALGDLLLVGGQDWLGVRRRGSAKLTSHFRLQGGPIVNARIRHKHEWVFHEGLRLPLVLGGHVEREVGQAGTLTRPCFNPVGATVRCRISHLSGRFGMSEPAHMIPIHMIDAPAEAAHG